MRRHVESRSCICSCRFLPKRRLLIVIGLIIFLLLIAFHFTILLQSAWLYQVPNQETIWYYRWGVVKAPSLKLKDIESLSHNLVREQSRGGQFYAPGYVYQYSIGEGFEGNADVYIDIATQKEVVIKTNLRNSRTKPIPETIRNRLRDEYKLVDRPYLNLTDWPVDIDATMRNYNGDNIKDLIIYATDIFLALPPKHPSTQDLRRMNEFHPWIIVYPRLPGSLASTQEALKYLNLTVSDIDYLYRPRFRRIFEALSYMHSTIDESDVITTTADNSNMWTGFCHDDVKTDNIFLRDADQNLILADLGQTRRSDDIKFVKWQDCRLVDAQRSWRTYLSLLRNGASRADGRVGARNFDHQFREMKEPWAYAYYKWVSEFQIPVEILSDPKNFWNLEPGSLQEEQNLSPPQAPNSYHGTGLTQSTQSMETWREDSDREILMPVYENGIITRVPMSREDGLRAIGKVCTELEDYKLALVKHKELMQGQMPYFGGRNENGYNYPEKPWWFWDVPDVLKNERVQTELQVYGPNTYLTGMYKVGFG